MKALCVSIHDVAPATWALCLRLEQAMRSVAPMPLTWLVVPRFHGDPARSPAMEERLTELAAGCDELALHGYTHLDTSPAASSPRARWLRHVYTQSEGEFAALDSSEATDRLALGLAWFRERGWHAEGFVPPAWLLGEGAWRSLRASPLSYTTTFMRFHSLATGRSVLSPSLVYSARNRTGRALSPICMDALGVALGRAPLVRLSLHPRDALSPRLLHHAQRLAERLLAAREPMTKAAFNQKYFQ